LRLRLSWLRSVNIFDVGKSIRRGAPEPTTATDDGSETVWRVAHVSKRPTP
jgi:hypothetical protein